MEQYFEYQAANGGWWETHPPGTFNATFWPPWALAVRTAQRPAQAGSGLAIAPPGGVLPAPAATAPATTGRPLARLNWNFEMRYVLRQLVEDETLDRSHVVRIFNNMYGGDARARGYAGDVPWTVLNNQARERLEREGWTVPQRWQEVLDDPQT